MNIDQSRLIRVLYPTKHFRMGYAEQHIRHVSSKIILKLIRILDHPNNAKTEPLYSVMDAQPTALRGKGSRLDLRGFSPKIHYLALHR